MEKCGQISLKYIIVRFSSLNPDGRTQGWTGHLEDEKTCFGFLPISHKSSSYIFEVVSSRFEDSEKSKNINFCKTNSHNIFLNFAFLKIFGLYRWWLNDFSWVCTRCVLEGILWIKIKGISLRTSAFAVPDTLNKLI